MTIAIIGSRNLTDKQLIYQKLDAIFANRKPDLIVSGGAKGPDTLGVLWGRDNEVAVKEFIPDWEKYGRGAGFKRNTQIVEAADLVIAFWDGESRGTKDSIDKARKLNKRVEIIKK
jgi:hypothetical protein